MLTINKSLFVHRDPPHGQNCVHVTPQNVIKYKEGTERSDIKCIGCVKATIKCQRKCQRKCQQCTMYAVDVCTMYVQCMYIACVAEGTFM